VRPDTPLNNLLGENLGEKESDDIIIANLTEAFKDRTALANFLIDNPHRRFKTNNRYECPVATFVNESFIEEGTAKLGFEPNAETGVCNPKWLRDFGKAIDAEPTPTVTSARALAILKSIPE